MSNRLSASSQISGATPDKAVELTVRSVMPDVGRLGRKWRRVDSEGADEVPG